eukprot:CAMPEP_0172778986 /NCGR_PEP_ID=MMETSP1074-20121228/202192_1 /TAXON_ID=2916 /ORGANISM="Ceratium fusus, Strain PA161109" /LENGTH=50 /DNA_ID=CAMNT_0013615941 /DNA_START=66 /DNA_END=218 /DNA_ORIENTATION=-
MTPMMSAAFQHMVAAAIGTADPSRNNKEHAKKSPHFGSSSTCHPPQPHTP